MVLLANFNECYACSIDDHNMCDGPNFGCECTSCYPDEYAESLEISVWE